MAGRKTMNPLERYSSLIETLMQNKTMDADMRHSILWIVIYSEFKTN